MSIGLLLERIFYFIIFSAFVTRFVLLYVKSYCQVKKKIGKNEPSRQGSRRAGGCCACRLLPALLFPSNKNEHFGGSWRHGEQRSLCVPLCFPRRPCLVDFSSCPSSLLSRRARKCLPFIKPASEKCSVCVFLISVCLCALTQECSVWAYKRGKMRYWGVKL